VQDSVSEEISFSVFLIKSRETKISKYFVCAHLKNNGAFVLRFSSVFVFIEENLCKHVAGYRQPARVEGRSRRPGDKLQSQQ
jgi:hypothetical protein